MCPILALGICFRRADGRRCQRDGAQHGVVMGSYGIRTGSASTISVIDRLDSANAESSSVVERVCHRIEIVVEKVGIGVEGHCC